MVRELYGVFVVLVPMVVPEVCALVFRAAVLSKLMVVVVLVVVKMLMMVVVAAVVGVEVGLAGTVP